MQILYSSVVNLCGTKLSDNEWIDEDYFCYKIKARVKKRGWKKEHSIVGMKKIGREDADIKTRAFMEISVLYEMMKTIRDTKQEPE